MIVRFSGALSEREATELQGRLEGRRIVSFRYDREGLDNYFILGLDDDSRVTIYLEGDRGALVLGEGFP